MVQTTCCGEGQECIVTDVSGLADPCMASCNVFYRLPDGSIWLLNKDGDGYLPVFVTNDQTKIDWNADPDSPTGISNRPFKAIGYGLKLDGSGNLVIDELVLPKPDWNETSTTSKDYIANKPFQTIGDHLYVEDGALNVCLENRTNELPNSTWNLGKPPWNDASFNTAYEIVDPEADKPLSHILHARPITATTQQIFQMPHPIPVTVGDVITVAFDFKDLNWTQSSNLMVLRVFPERDTPQNQANSLQNVSWNSNTFGITGETTEFRRLVHSFTVTATGFLNVIPYNSDGTGNYEQWYREIMVIKGEECEMPDRWYPYFTDVPIPEQIQSDWDVSDTTSPAYIKNKPEIVDQVQSDWNETNETSPAFILNKPTIPEGAVLYPSTGQNTDGAMTQKATTDELAKKANVTDLAGYVTLDTDQTIESTKTWGEIITDGTGEHGQITTVSPDGTIHQLQKVAGSNEYSEVEIAYGRIMVTRYQSDGTPIRSSLFTEDGESRSTDRMYTNIPMHATEWEANSAQVKVRNGILVVHIAGARPLTTIDGNTGGNLKTVATLPPEFASLLTENIEFMWSNYGGGQITYPGRLDTNGQVKLYIIPTASSIVPNHRFSIYLPIIL